MEEKKNRKKELKAFYFSHKAIREAVENCLAVKCTLTHTSESKCIEEYIMAGIVREFDGFPDLTKLGLRDDVETLRNELLQRYLFADKKFLTELGVADSFVLENLIKSIEAISEEKSFGQCKNNI